MSDFATLEAGVNQEIRRCLSVALERYGKFIDFPTVTYDVRGKVAGYANSIHNKVRFNYVLLMENGQTFIDRTVRHEMAHIICDKVYGHLVSRNGRRQAHGKHWKSVMRVLGGDPSRCHSYDVSNTRVRRTTKYVYVCANCGTEVTMGKQRHMKQTLYGCYHHRGCGKSPLVFKGTVMTGGTNAYANAPKR